MAVIGAFALIKFLNILDPSNTPDNEDEMLSKLCSSPEWIATLFEKSQVAPNPPPCSSSFTSLLELLRWANEATDLQYSASFNRLLARLEEEEEAGGTSPTTLPADVALRLGEAIIMCSMDGDNRDQIVFSCMRDLDEDTMLDLQRAIQRWKSDDAENQSEEDVTTTARNSIAFSEEEQHPLDDPHLLDSNNSSEGGPTNSARGGGGVLTPSGPCGT